MEGGEGNGGNEDVNGKEMRALEERKGQDEEKGEMGRKSESICGIKDAGTQHEILENKLRNHAHTGVQGKRGRSENVASVLHTPI